MSKLIICYIGQDCEKFIGMSLDSIKDVVDYTIFVDGGSTDDTIRILDKYGFKTISTSDGTFDSTKIFINRPYEQDHKGANGRARNAYLKFIQEHFLNDYCLVLDPDEVVENPQHIKTWIEQAEKQKQLDNIILNPHMRHFIGDFGHEDHTYERHYCPGRFFKITKDLYYDEVEHPVLQCRKNHQRMNVEGFTIWHLAYIDAMFYIKNRYLNHLKNSCPLAGKRKTYIRLLCNS